MEPKAASQVYIKSLKFNLYPLGLDSDSASRMQFDMVANLYGINPDSISARLTCTMFILHVRGRSEFCEFRLEFRQEGISKTLSVNSEYIECYFQDNIHITLYQMF